MLRRSRPEPASTRPSPISSSFASSILDSKKYTKRRYTDSRHQTRHIPDAESLGSSTPSRLSSSILHHSSITSTTSGTSKNVTSTGSTSQPVWKRRELISSAPKQRGAFFWDTITSVEHIFFVFQCFSWMNKVFQWKDYYNGCSIFLYKKYMSKKKKKTRFIQISKKNN